MRTANGSTSRMTMPMRTAGEGRFMTYSSRPACSRSASEQSLRPDEDHHHEEQECDRIAPPGRKAQPADRDEFADDKSRDEAADHAAEPAEHADHEDERAELQSDLRIDVV